MLLQIGAALVIAKQGSGYYESRQPLLLQIRAELLQIEAAVTNWGKFITNTGSYYKSGQLFQIGEQK